MFESIDDTKIIVDGIEATSNQPTRVNFEEIEKTMGMSHDEDEEEEDSEEEEPDRAKINRAKKVKSYISIMKKFLRYTNYISCFI